MSQKEQKGVFVSSEAHKIAKTAAAVEGKKLFEYMSKLVIENAPRYDFAMPKLEDSKKIG